MMFKNSLHHKSPLGLAILSLALHGSVWQSQAQITLHDQNSTAQIDPHSQAGMFHWDIQGQNELVQQWFWYRIGPAGPERSLDTISPAAVSPFLGSRGVAITYTGPQFSIETDYTLTGGAPAPPGQIGQADMGESIRINNLTGTTLDFHFFQYSDFDLAGPGNDTVTLGTDSSGRFNSASQSDGVSTLTESVSVAAPSADHGEAAFFNATLVKLNNGGPDVLNDNPSAGPGDVTWALEWDLLIAPGNSALISKDKHLQVQIVPEPSSFALIGLAFLAGRFCSRRRK